MIKKRITLIMVTSLLVIIIIGIVWIYYYIQPPRVTLKGYIDSVGRRAYQQIITAYIGSDSYPNFYFFVGNKNDPLKLDSQNNIALVEKENSFLADVYDQELTITGTRKMGKICYYMGKPLKVDSGTIQKCHNMPILIIEDILTKEGFSLVYSNDSEVIGYKPKEILQHPLVCANQYYFDTDKYGQIVVCYIESVGCNKVSMSGKWNKVNIPCPDSSGIGKCPYSGYYLVAEKISCV